ncbi:MAG: nuclear transport factor 2 family protein [Sphingomonadales bacterium]|nr:nuclear transport factor 2 family protein [Sphingomonadales bacterium]
MAAATELLAIERIRQLKARYFRMMDTRDFTALGELFTADATFDFTEALGFRPVGGAWQGKRGGVVRGREAIVETIRRALAEATSAHHGHDFEITIESASEARGIVAMTDTLRGLDRVTPRLHGAGHYHDRYRCEAGTWRIAETRLVRLFLDRDAD